MLSLVDSNAHATAPAAERERFPLAPLANDAGEADETYEPSLEELVPLMDAAQVDQAFLIASRNHGFDNSYCVDAAARYPGRFATVAAINVYSARAIDDIAYWINERGMHGVRLLGGGRGVAHWTDDARYLSVWQYIDELGVPANAQMTRPETIPNTRRLLEQIPTLRLTVNYLGHVPVGEGATSAGAKDLFGLAEYPNVYVNVAVEFLEQTLQVPSPAHDLLGGVLDAFGAARFLWSAFYPSPPRYPYETAADIVRRSVLFLSEEDQEWAVGGAGPRPVSLAARLRRDMDEISAVMNPFPHTSELMGGEREIDGVRVVFRSSEGAATTRSMLRELAFDVCAMPIVNYLSAREHGLQAIGIPVFLTRRFPQAMLVCDRTQVAAPGDLEGKRVGIGYYGNTDSTWVRGMLAVERVELDQITWVTSSEEQVHGVVLPPNVEPYRQEGALDAYSGVPGSELDELLLEGKLAAVIYGRGERVYGEGDEGLGSDRFGPLDRDVAAAEAAWYRSTGLFPILSTLVMRVSVLDAHPNLAQGLLNLFGEAKEHALRQLEEGKVLGEAGLAGARMSGFPATPLARSSRAYLGRDPLPYGVEDNRATLEAIVRFAYDQHVLDAAVDVDALFAPGT